MYGMQSLDNSTCQVCKSVGDPALVKEIAKSYSLPNKFMDKYPQTSQSCQNVFVHEDTDSSDTEIIQ